MNIPKYCPICGSKLEFKIKIKEYNIYTGKPIVYLEGECRGHAIYKSESGSLNSILNWVDSDDDIEYTLDSKLKKTI